MYNKISLFFLVILVSCMGRNMDLSKLNFDEKIENYQDIIEVKEIRDVDLADDYRFYKMDDEGAIERNKSEVIRDYNISPDSKEVSYQNIPFDELLIRTVNGNIIGYKFETYNVDHTENLRQILKESMEKVSWCSALMIRTRARCFYGEQKGLLYSLGP